MPWKGLLILLLAAFPFFVNAQCDDDDPPSGSISASEVGCGGGQVTITFSLSGDDDDFDVQYRIGGSTFSLSNIADGHTVTRTVTTSTTATLVSVTQRDDDDGDVCTVTINQTINITVGAAPNLNLSTTNPGCNQTNGRITAQASGGQSPYQFSLNGGTFQSSSIFSGLGAGSYSVTVRDASGCENSGGANLTGGTAPTLTVSVTNQPGCNQSNGSISASASGGRSPYQFSLNGGAFQSSGIFSGLAAGSYSVTVRDANDCETSRTANLTGGTAPTLTVSITNQPGCNQSNGSISAQASGGQSPYQFSLNGGTFQSSSIFSGLAAGSYSVTVRDASGCENSQNANLVAATAPTLTVSITNQPGCNQNNGSISASTSGGRSPYQYSLNGGTFQSNSIFSGLAVGSYSVTVRDANGCETSRTANLQSTTNLTISLNAVLQPTCAGKDGSITIQTTGGIAPITYSIDGGAFQNNATFNGLSHGTYTVTARDANNCQISTTAILNNPAAGLVNAQIITTNPRICPGTTLTLSANLPQNTTGRWTASSNAVQFGNANSRTTTVTASQPGVYTLTWTLSALNCPNYSKATVVLNVPAPPQAEDDGVFEIEATSTINIAVLKNDLPSQDVRIRILKTPMLGTAQLLTNDEIRYEAFEEESGRDTLMYQICLDACPTLCDTALVVWQIGSDICDLENVDPRVIFPEGITPNGDGYNEALEFKIVDKLGCPINYAQSDISIFNRWGDKVFHQEPYENSWNGNTDDGKELPPGVYYYALRVRREGKKDYVRFGNVSIFR